MKSKKKLKNKKILLVKKQAAKPRKKSFVAPKKKIKKLRKVIKKTAVKSKTIVLKKSLQPVKKKPKPTKKPLKLQQPEEFLAGSFFKAKIKVIGIGGGGGSIVSEIGRSLNKATFVIADTDTRAFKNRAGIKNFIFGQSLTHGLGTGVDPQLGRLAAEQDKEKITRFFDDQDIVVFIASLGGGLGSGATQVFAEAAKDFNGITFGIFTLPFKFEGRNKYNIAVKSLRELRKSLNVSITIPNEKIFKVIAENTAITDAFSMVNKNLIESLESLIDLIYSPGIINIDFADLRAILKGKGNMAFLNTVEASGKNKAEDIARKILHNPLYQNNNFTAEKILFNIAGGDQISMLEVDKISRAISEQNPKAKIIFGISKNPKFKNKIKTTVLMTGGGTEEEMAEALEPKKVQPQKKPKAIKVAPVKTTPKKPKKVVKKIPQPVQEQESPVISFPPVTNSTPAQNIPVESNASKITIVEAQVRPKKPIRRSAMDIKKAQDREEQKQTQQEKEWEIPAFLRIKK